jgi:hypothetical protein
LCATSIEEALNLIKFADLIMTDWYYRPESRTAEVIVANAGDCPIIIYTVAPDDVPVGIGARYVFEKPCSMEVLTGAIRKILGVPPEVSLSGAIKCPNCDDDMIQIHAAKWHCQGCGHEELR